MTRCHPAAEAVIRTLSYWWLLFILVLLLLALPSARCRYLTYEKDSISLGGGTRTGLVTRYIAR